LIALRWRASYFVLQSRKGKVLLLLILQSRISNN
jgi:hypothetical protein